MADFGKLNFSVSFNPTSAFPVDARYHFTTLAAAQAAAQGAVEVGSSEGTYFFGETVVVQTATDATLYVIQPNKTLKALGSSSDVSTLRAAVEAAQEDATQALSDAAAAQATADAKVASVTVGNGIEKTGTDTAPVLDVKVDPVEGNLIEKTEAGLKVIAPEQTDYTVTVETPTGTEYSASYVFKQLGSTLATINIPKDMVVSSGEVVTYTEETKPAEVATAGTYIVLTIANKTSDKLYINVSDLLDDKTIEGVAGTDITVTADSSEGPVKISATINEGAVQTKHIADSAVTTAKINGKAVTTEKIADSAVDTLQIKDNAVTTSKVLDSAITTDKINAKAVTSAKIADGAVGETQIADGAVTIDKIATAAKTTAIVKETVSDTTVPTTKAVTDYVDTALDAKANAADVYTKTEVDTELAKKANSATTLAGYCITDAYTKTEVNTELDKKADSATTLAGYGITDAYTSTEVDTELAKKADKTYVDTELGKKANSATTISGYGITDAYTKDEVDAKVSSVYKYKGTVASVSALPTVDLTVGDVYNVETAGTIGSGESAIKVNAGDNVAWTGSAWDVLAGTVDLSSYYTKIETDDMLSVKLEDAPSDGKQYARNNGAWSEVVIPEVITPDLDKVLTAGNTTTSYAVFGVQGGSNTLTLSQNVITLDSASGETIFGISAATKTVSGDNTIKTSFNSFLQNTVSGTTAKIDGTTLTKSHVGLSNVTNESKETMFTNPTFTGTVTVPTPTVDTAAATKKYVDDTVGAVKPTLDDVLTNGNTTTKSAIFTTATSKIEVDSEKIALSSISGDIDTKQFELSYSSTPGVTGSEAMRTAFVNWLNTGTIYRYSA